MVLITKKTERIRIVLNDCWILLSKAWNCGDPTESSLLMLDDSGTFGKDKGVDCVSIIEVSERNEDIPSTFPSDGLAISTPRLFRSR